jgi:hypothetical protein
MEEDDEDEDEFVSDNEAVRDDDDEKIPRAVSIRKDTVGISHAT